MSGLNNLYGQIKNGRSKVYRRLFIKRRQTNGAYEDNWLDISDDVIKWGSIKKETDAAKINQFRFNAINVTMNNLEGKYNPYGDDNSLWYNYSDQQRTLVKIEAGFLYETKTNGIWSRTEFPSSNIVFSGFIYGDINIKGTNQISIPIVPLQEVFRQFSSRRLTGFNNSLTASDFMYLLRDQQDDLGSYVFRPFFGNTSTGFEITATSIEYSNLDTSTAKDIIDTRVWDVIEKLAEAENYSPYVTRDGKFRFVPRDTGTTSVFHFYGPGNYSSYYGRTIKAISFYGFRQSKYYSRVQVKWVDADTATSYEVSESNFRVLSTSTPWVYGEKTLEIENFWIPTATVAETIADDLFQEFSSAKKEIEFTTSFIPQLDIFDRVQITYDPVQATENGLWDVYNWADSTGATAFDDELIWDYSAGDAIRLNGAEFKLISIEINLDNLECKFVGRE